MTDLTCLKVRIGLAANGRGALYPDFNQLAVVQESAVDDWSVFVDRFGQGWKYDALCGHREEDATSPLGTQWGMLVVPEAFADQAEVMFPAQCARLSEAEAQQFYDERAAAKMPEFTQDEQVLAALEREEQRIARATPVEMPDKTARLEQIREAKRRAEDPDDPARGVRRVRDKTWAGLKQMTGMTYKEKASF